MYVWECMCERLAGDLLSQLSGDDGERPDGTAGLQLQGREEAVRGLSAAAALQCLPKATPCFMGQAMGLNSIS